MWSAASKRPALCGQTTAGVVCRDDLVGLTTAVTGDCWLLVCGQVPRLQQRLETYLVRFEAAPALADARRVLDAHAAAIRCRTYALSSRSHRQVRSNRL